MSETLRDKVIAEIKSMIEDATDVYNYEIKENLWEKYGKSRTYIKVVETRENSKHYASYDFGFIDNVADNYVSGKLDAFGKYGLNGMAR